MKNKNRCWGILIALMVLVLVACLLPPLSKPKARPSRIAGVNNISSFSITSTNGVTTTTPSK